MIIILKKSCLALCAVCVAGNVLAQPSHEKKAVELLKTLKTPQAKYELPEKVSAKERDAYKTNHEVGWVIPPDFSFTEKELRNIRLPVTVRITIVASSGYVADTEIIKSTGSAKVDEKVKKALQLAKVDPIPGVDKYLTYKMEHDFYLRKTK